MLADAARHQLVVTAEDGVRHGGAGAFLVDAMSAQVDSEGLPMPAIRVLGIPRQFLAQGKADDILASLGSGRRRHRRERAAGQARGAGGGAAALTASTTVRPVRRGRPPATGLRPGRRGLPRRVAQADPLSRLQHGSSVDARGEPAPSPPCRRSTSTTEIRNCHHATWFEADEHRHGEGRRRREVGEHLEERGWGCPCSPR